MGLGWLEAAAGPPAPDPLPLRRVIIPADRLPKELERVRQGILVQQPREEFEARVKRAAEAGERLKSPPRLVNARYWARLEGTALVGGGDWTIMNPGPDAGVLPLPDVNLALSRVKMGATDAVLGDLDG